MGKAVTPHNPCVICGKPDWCLVVDGKNGPLHMCKRMRESEVISGGHTYILVRETDECGVYEEKEQNLQAKKAWIEEKKASDPNWKNKSFKSKASSKPPTNPKKAAESGYINRSSYKNEFLEPTSDPARLDRVYQAFLNCLSLDKRHEEMLKKEWGDLYQTLINQHPIKTMPMVDKERYAYGAYFESPWRKKIMQDLLSVVDESDIIGSAEDRTGIPGFYQLGSQTTFYKLAGVVFPIYNTKGQIIRLRIRDDFPAAKGTFEGAEGYFYFKTDGWYFRPAEGAPVLVHQPKSKTYKVKLDKNGVPLSDGGVKSKVSGKYKNFSSFQEEPDDEAKCIRNRYTNGCQSGSFPSLYAPEGADYTAVFFTEGEKKAMVASQLLNAPCVSFPGVGTFRTAFERRCDEQSIIDHCRSKGMVRGVLCYDADKNTNADVLRAEKNCVQWFIENGVQLSIGSWNQAFGKGLDDVLLMGIRPTIHNLS